MGYGLAMGQARLRAIELPDFGYPGEAPDLPQSLYAGRLERLAARLGRHLLDALVIYGDREHMANICWATGHDPRFEEAILVVVPGRTPHLLLGNEGFPYAGLAPGIFERVLWQPLSLMGQPRDHYRPLPALLRDAGLGDAMRIGLAGWKGFESEDGVFDSQWFETPAYLVEALHEFGHVENAAPLLMNPADGLRVINEVEQLGVFEYQATRTSSSLRRLIEGIRPGMSEYEAARLMRFDGTPHSVSFMLSTGPRARYGLPSPSPRIIERGDPVTCAFGLPGGLNARAGFMVADASELPPAIAGYVEKLVAPYFEAAVAWYETLAIGATGTELYDSVMSRLSDPFFGIGLNPGHLIHLDEWVHSPVRKDSSIQLASGMALQCDIIPATGTDYFTTNIEDGVALADEALRAGFREKYPDAWTRIQARRDFMMEVLGIRLKPEVLPFSSIPAWLPPFWLSPGLAMTMA